MEDNSVDSAIATFDSGDFELDTSVVDLEKDVWRTCIEFLELANFFKDNKYSTTFKYALLFLHHNLVNLLKRKQSLVPYQIIESVLYGVEVVKKIKGLEKYSIYNAELEETYKKSFEVIISSDPFDFFKSTYEIILSKEITKIEQFFNFIISGLNLILKRRIHYFGINLGIDDFSENQYPGLIAYKKILFLDSLPTIIDLSDRLFGHKEHSQDYIKSKIVKILFEFDLMNENVAQDFLIKSSKNKIENSFSPVISSNKQVIRTMLNNGITLNDLHHLLSTKNLMLQAEFLYSMIYFLIMRFEILLEPTQNMLDMAYILACNALISKYYTDQTWCITFWNRSVKIMSEIIIPKLNFVDIAHEYKQKKLNMNDKRMELDFFNEHLEDPFMSLSKKMSCDWFKISNEITNTANNTFEEDLLKKCIENDLNYYYIDYTSILGYTFYLLKSIATVNIPNNLNDNNGNKPKSLLKKIGFNNLNSYKFLEARNISEKIGKYIEKLFKAMQLFSKSINRLKNKDGIASMFLHKALCELNSAIDFKNANIKNSKKDSITVGMTDPIIFPKIELSDLFFEYIKDNYNIENFQIRNIVDDMKDLDFENQVFFMYSMCRWANSEMVEMFNTNLAEDFNTMSTIDSERTII